ncbi:MAG: homoserine O-acetyltransferase [Elusimicrobiota bacterium]
MDKKSIVETKYFNCIEKGNDFILESGQTLSPITIAYETYGGLNKDKSNAILVEHAFSGDAHAAFYHEGDKKPGWWDAMIGPGKALDTDKYFIICSNVLGGCMGSTGPSSINPETKKPYALDFPVITIGDMVKIQKMLIDYLGIKKLLCVIGGSMGGMQALQWIAAYPEMVRTAIPIATTLKHSPQQIAFSEVGRQAIMADAEWRGGNYYGNTIPERGLAVARMVGHITYMSDYSMEQKFSRRMKEEKGKEIFPAEFEVEGYLRYQGDSFVKRFDANSYLYITKAMDYFDLSGDNFVAHDCKTKMLVIAFHSDWLYPLYQSIEIVKALKRKRIAATYCAVPSTYGHDAFLLEIEDQTKLVSNFLRANYEK